MENRANKTNEEITDAEYRGIVLAMTVIQHAITSSKYITI